MRTSLKSHEANKRVIKDRAKLFADRLGVSPSTVYKWTEESPHTSEPSCVQPSGRRNPVDTIEQSIEIAIAFGDPREDYMAQVTYLEERFNRLGIDLPDKLPEPKDLMQELTRTIKEFGDLVKVSAAAIETEGVDRRENERIQREGWQVLRQTALLMKLADMQAKGAAKK